MGRGKNGADYLTGGGGKNRADYQRNGGEQTEAGYLTGGGTKRGVLPNRERPRPGCGRGAD